MSPPSQSVFQMKTEKRHLAILAVLAVFKEEGVSLKGWNVDTMRRYLQIARKLTEDVTAILQRSEILFKREAYLDGITNLRAAVTSCATNEDLVFLINKLVLEQASNIRQCGDKSKKDHHQTPVNIAKGILLRRDLFAHLSSIFPALEEDIKQFAGDKFYHTYYGINSTGLRDPDWVKSDDAISDDDGDGDGGHQNASCYASRNGLQSFARRLAAGNFERTFTVMAATCTDDRKLVLDLTSTASAPLTRQIQLLQNDYLKDFPPAPAPEATLPVSPAKLALEASPSVVETVTTDNPENNEGSILSDAEYTARLIDWQVDVQAYEEKCMNTFINGRLQNVVDDQSDPVNLKRKMSSKCSLLGEKKRKLFLFDDLVKAPVDSELAKRRKISIFEHSTPSLNSSHLSPMLEVYTESRTVDDNNESDDCVMVVAQAGPPDQLESPNLNVAFKEFKNLIPKHQAPKIGTVERDPETWLKYFGKSKKAFVGRPDHHLIFTTQKKQLLQRAPFKTLKGNSLFNKWVVPVQNPSEMTMCNVADVENLFAAPGHENCIDDGEGISVPEEETAIDATKTIPFPKELPVEFFEEICNVFSPDVFAIFSTGTGNPCKALLKSNLRGVVVFNTAAHKSLVMKELREFVRAHSLVNFPNPPEKSPQLLKWEAAKSGSNPPAPLTTTTPTPVPETETATKEVPSPAAGLRGFGSSLL